MKNFVVGAFAPEAWSAHGKQWMESVVKYKGKAGVLVFKTPDTPVEGVAKVYPFFGISEFLDELSRVDDAVFLYMAPNVRLQAEPNAIFETAKNFVVTVSRKTSAISYPFAGEDPVHETFWAAPFDLIDMMKRAFDLGEATHCLPPYIDGNHISYFVRSFPWFNSQVDDTEFMTCYDAVNLGSYYGHPTSKARLTAVSVEKPEARRASVIRGGVVPSRNVIDKQAEKHDDGTPEPSVN